MNAIRLAVVALVVVPAIASAQRRGQSRGSARADWDNVTSTSGKSGVQLSTKDVEKMDPVKLLVDKRKDLNLSDDQRKQVDDLDGKLRDSNKDLLNTLDSLRKETKLSSSRPSDEDVARAAIARSAFMDVLGHVRSRYDSRLAQALPLLDATQLAKANQFLEEQRSESEKTIREKLLSGGGRRGTPRGGDLQGGN